MKKQIEITDKEFSESFDEPKHLSTDKIFTTKLSVKELEQVLAAI